MARKRTRRRTRRRRSKNSWFGAPRRHRKAALKGWRGRRRTRRRRRRARNSWTDHAGLHRRAAKLGWRRRRRYGKRRRRRNMPYRHRRKMSYNMPRRGRYKRRKKYNAYRRHRYRNPGVNTSLSISRPVQAVTAGFNYRTLTDAGVIVGGALGNAWLSGLVSGFLPGIAAQAPFNYATGLATAGILGAGVGAASPRLAGKVFFGGVLEVVMRAVKEYVVPLIPFPVMSGMGDYLTRYNASEARGLGDYLTRNNASEARGLGDMADYLTRSNASEARGLGYTYDYYGDDTISEELAGL